MAKLRNYFVWASALISLLLPLYLMGSALGVKFGVFDWRFGLLTLIREWGVYYLIAALALGVLALILSLVLKPRQLWFVALFAVLVPLGVGGYGYSIVGQARALPPIHDISTDLFDPPDYSDTVMDMRGDASNSVDLLNATTPDGQSVIAQQKEAYGDIEAIATGLPPEIAFDLALQTMRTRPWAIVTADKEGGRIEAVATSFWFGFRDDVVVRVRPDGQGARIDMRSTSRVGQSDLGANAGRMRVYLEDLRARIADAEREIG